MVVSQATYHLSCLRYAACFSPPLNACYRSISLSRAAMRNDRIVRQVENAQTGEKLVIFQRTDGLFQYRQEWIEPEDDGLGIGRSHNERSYQSIFNNVEDAERDAFVSIPWLALRAHRQP
jgi:hypothetical protein